MAEPRLHILFEFKPGPWGGGNQFLKALAGQLRRMGHYAETPDDADAILLNSHHQLDVALQLRSRLPDTAFVHRVDGPLATSRGRYDLSDQMIFATNAALADGTVFQSEWSRTRTLELGLRPRLPAATITNAPDPALFFRPENRPVRRSSDRLRIVSSSWSNNPAKGFAIYQWLDQHLDFSRYAFTFVGNSPVSFSNIVVVKPVESRELGDVLRDADVFLTASSNDACPNSLLEALHCGLPAIALDSGGHPEVLGQRGWLFQRAQEVPALLEKLSNDASGLDLAPPPDMAIVAKQYVQFTGSVLESMGGRSSRRNRERYLRLQLAMLRGLQLMLSPLRNRSA